jgi:hypothetical protein
MKNRSAAVSFMKGYIRGCRYYYDNALMKREGAPHQEILNTISRYTEEKTDIIALALPYNDRNGELYAEDIQKQLDWYHRNGMVEKKIFGDAFIDCTGSYGGIDVCTKYGKGCKNTPGSYHQPNLF